MAFTAARVKARLRESIPDRLARPDMLAHFIAAKEKYPDIMTDEYIHASAVLNVGAGALTTSKVLEGIFRFLVANPAGQERLLREMQDAYCTYPISYKQTQQIPYLEGLIREGVRLHISLGVILLREVSASGLELPNTVLLPPGTNVGIKPYALTNREDIFGENPLTFNPERWLQNPLESGDAFRERRLVMIGEISRLDMVLVLA